MQESFPGYEPAHLGAGFYLSKKSCCQNSILGDKKVHTQRNSVCARLPVHLKPEFLLGSAYLIAEFLSKL
ncbi:MAG: hypothetical protein V9G16_11830 [Nitrosomonas sp.]